MAELQQLEMSCTSCYRDENASALGWLYRQYETQQQEKEVARKIGRALRHMTGLQHLTLTSINDWILAGLASSLGRLTGLERLRISGTYCRGTVSAALLSTTKLKHLDLSGIRLFAQGVASLASALRGLQQLNLHDNGMGSEGAAALAPVLQALTGLQQLDLSVNAISWTGAQAVAPALQALTGLQQLNLSGNQMGLEGAAALAPALRSMAMLEQLKLANNSLGLDGAAALAPALEVMTGLRELRLSRNKFGPKGAAVLAPLFQSMTALEHLELSLNNLGERGVATLVSALPRRQRQGSTGPTYFDLRDERGDLDSI